MFWGPHHICWGKVHSPHSTHSQWIVWRKGARENKGYVILCFVVPTTSVGARLTPSLLPLLPMDQAEVGGSGEQGVCCTMFWGPTTSVGARLAPLTSSSLLAPNGSSRGRGQWRKRGMLYYALGSPSPLWG